MKLPYKEGDIFGIPLRDGGFAIGVVARATKRGKILLGYFFPYFFATAPSSSIVPELRPEDAIRVVRFGDLSLMNGEWPIVDHVKDWQSNRWPMPKFIRQDPLAKQAWLVSYNDSDPSVVVGKESCAFDVAGYERDALLGAGAVELALTKLVRSE